MYDGFVNVFLFTGFLEAGKTRFIQTCFENPNFCTGESTLLLICEEGEGDYDPARFAAGGVVIERIEDKSRLSRESLERLSDRHRISRAVIEYNGMWMLEDLYRSMPDKWRVRQEMLFIDSGTFMSYNSNLRQLMYDKLSSCMVAVFNEPDGDLDRALVHRIVRGASRWADIVYQFSDGRTEYDTEKEDLPFDLDAPVVVIKDDEFALWSRDITDEPDKYDGKTLQLKCSVVLNQDMAADEMGIGRHVMVCCENDIQFVGFMCTKPDGLKPENDQWLNITGKLEMKYHPTYEKVGPVFSLISAEPCFPPSQAVATFY